MKIFNLIKISKFISWIFLFLISALVLLFLLVSFRPIKINFLNEIIDNQTVLDKYKVNKIGDVYFGFNKFSKKFEILIENIESESYNIPNLLLGFNIKNLFQGSIQPTIFKVYDSKLVVDLEDYKTNIENLDSKLLESFLKDKDEKLHQVFDKFEIIEFSNSFFDLTYTNNKIIKFGPVDLKIEKNAENFKVKGLIQKKKRESLSFEFTKEKFLNLKMTFKNFKFEIPPGMMDNIKYVNFSEFTLNGDSKIRFTDDYQIIDFYSQTDLGCLLNIKDNNVKVFLEGTVKTAFNNNTLYTNFNFTDKNSKINLSHYFYTKKKNQELTLFIDQISMKNLKKYWPIEFKTSTIEWINPNINGQLENINIKFSFSENFFFNANKFKARFDFFDVSIKYQEQMPRVDNVIGSAEFSGESLNFIIEEGISEKVIIKNSFVTINDLQKPIEKISIELNINSSSKDFLNYLSTSPVETSNFKRLNLIKGKPSINLKLNFPLLKELELNQINYFAEIHYTKSQINNIYGNFNLDDSDIFILVDKEKLKYNGYGNIKKMKVEFDGQEIFSASKKEENINIDIEFEPKVLNEFYSKFISSVKGIIPININITIDKLNEETKILGKGDLSFFSGLLNKFDYDHNYDEGEILFSSKLNNFYDTYKSEISINSRNFKIDSEIDKKENENLYIYLKKVVSPSQDFSAKIKKVNNKFDVSVTGNKLNFEKLFDKPDQIKNNIDLDFSIKINQFVYKKLTTINPILFGSIKQGKFDNLLLEFTENNESHIVKILKKGKKKIFKLSSDNGKAFLSFFDYSPNIKTGKLYIEGFENDGVYNGKILLDSFVAYDAPFFAKVLTLFSLDGLEQNLKDGGIFFESLESDYSFKENIIYLKDGLVKGSDLGLTFNGSLSFFSDDFEISGTLVPAYTLNTLITKVPIIGDIISIGSPEEGILASTFNIKNFEEEIKIEFNPISVLVPSIIRNLIKLDDIK